MHVNFPIYLDCNATTPLDPEVGAVLFHYLTEEFGNEGSRTHEYGARAKQAVQKARDQVAAVVGAKRDEVIFTSGATESNNLAILGLAEWGAENGKRHIISTRIEHKAVLEPVEELQRRGFEVSWLSCDGHGRVRLSELDAALRQDTLLVSVMAANNETGVRQPLGSLCGLLDGHQAFLHTDAAQAYGKDLESLTNPRIDLISVSGHNHLLDMFAHHPSLFLEAGFLGLFAEGRGRAHGGRIGSGLLERKQDQSNEPVCNGAGNRVVMSDGKPSGM